MFSEIDSNLPSSGVRIVKKVSGTGSHESAAHNGVPLNSPLRLFSRESHITTVGSVPLVPCEPLNCDNCGIFIETIAVVVKEHALKSTKILSALLEAPKSSGLSLIGMRYVKLSEETLSKAKVTLSSLRGMEAGGMLVLAIRGPQASSRWSNLVGPTDPILARQTDPHSLRALFGKGVDKNIVRNVPNIPKNSLRELIFFFGGRMKDESSAIQSQANLCNLLAQKSSVGVGGPWPSSGKGNQNLKRVEEVQGGASISKKKTPATRHAYYLSPLPCSKCIVEVSNDKVLGRVLEVIVSTAGFKIDQIQRQRQGSKTIVHCIGEGGASTLRSDFCLCGYKGVFIEDVDSDKVIEVAMPSREEVALGLGNPPKPIRSGFKEDLDEIEIVLITPDCFKRDFTKVDVPFGSVCNRLLEPFSEIADVGGMPAAVKTGISKIQCKHNVRIAAMKILPEVGPELAESLARDLTVSQDDAKLLTKTLRGGRCMAIVLKGSSGFAKALKKRIGPSELCGGSLAARGVLPESIKASYAGEESEPALVRGINRRSTYNAICRLFCISEISGGNGASHLHLFPTDCPPELVLLSIKIRRLGPILKRAERGDFECILLGMSSNDRVRAVLRRANGRKRWQDIMEKLSQGGMSDDDIAVLHNQESSELAFFGSDCKAENCLESKISGCGVSAQEASSARPEGSCGWPKSEGSIDGFGELNFVRKSISLRETVVVVVPPSVLRHNGLSMVCEAIQRSVSGFNVVACRLHRFTMQGAGEWCGIREKNTKGGRYPLSKTEICKIVEAGEGSCCFVVALECDNALVRSCKLISQGADFGKGKLIGVEGANDAFRRRRDDGGTGAFLNADRKPLCFGSFNGALARSELPFFFNKIWGEDTLQ